MFLQLYIGAVLSLQPSKWGSQSQAQSPSIALHSFQTRRLLRGHSQGALSIEQLKQELAERNQLKNNPNDNKCDMAKGNVWCEGTQHCVPVWQAATLCPGMSEEQAEATLAKWEPKDIQATNLPDTITKAIQAEISVAEAVRSVWLTVYSSRSQSVSTKERRKRESEQRTRVIEAEKLIELAAQVINMHLAVVFVQAAI